MRAVIISDIHIHNFKQFDVNGSRLDNCLKVIDEVYKLCTERDIENILFLGDLYDNQRMLPTVVVNRLIQKFNSRIHEHPFVKWYAITGNHDLATKSLYNRMKVSALEHIQEIFPNHFKIIDGARAIVDGVSVWGIPFYEFHEHFREALKSHSELAAKKKGKHVLLIHQTPAGITNRNIQPDTQPEDGLYKPFDFVFCGHIHERQSLAPNFMVVGSPLHKDLGDEGQDKGVLILDTDERTIETISWKGKFPEFVSYTEGSIEVQDEQHNGHYAVVRPAKVAATPAEMDVADKFSTDLKNEELIRNYWQEVEGTDEELLRTGLSFL